MYVPKVELKSTTSRDVGSISIITAGWEGERKKLPIYTNTRAKRVEGQQGLAVGAPPAHTHQLLVEDEARADARREPGADDQQEGYRGILVVFLGGTHPVPCPCCVTAGCCGQSRNPAHCGCLGYLLFGPCLFNPVRHVCVWRGGPRGGFEPVLRGVDRTYSTRWGTELYKIVPAFARKMKDLGGGSAESNTNLPPVTAQPSRKARLGFAHMSSGAHGARLD